MPRTEMDLIKYKLVAITVDAVATSGASAADADLIGGIIFSITPTGNQDAFVENVALGATGIVTVTTATTTAINTFNVLVLQET